MNDLPFPARVITHAHSATLGKTGAGKSSALRGSAEYLLDRKKRVTIIDPKGDWWGLKASASGSGAGYPVICFGDFKEPRATDVPINDQSGAHVAELIASGNRPCVIGFRGWMPAQLVRFWLGFAPTLFKVNEGELYVFIDEVHNLAPKGKILDPESGKCLHWTNRIMSEGRGLGLTFHIASQRSQKVHNDTLDNCETLVAMRVTHPAARQSIKDWIDGNGDPAAGKEVLATLAALERGEAWIWSPENDFGPKRVKFPMFTTFDSFAPPQLQKKVIQAGWAEVDLDQVKQKLADVVAEHKANDPKELKAEVARLRIELSRKQVPVPAAPISAGPTKEQIEQIVKRSSAPAIKQLDQLRAAVSKVIDRACTELLTFRDGLAVIKIPTIEIAAAAAAPQQNPQPTPAVRKQLPAPVAAAESNGRLETGEKAVLLAAAQNHPADRESITVLTGYRRSARNRYIQFLQAKGFIEDQGGNIVPTSAGMAALGSDYTPLPTGSDLQRYWLERLPKGEKDILAFVLRSGGQPVDRELLSEATGYLRSTRNRYIQLLQARHLLKAGASSVVTPAAMLFDGAERKMA